MTAQSGNTRRKSTHPNNTPPGKTRCALYTRKSSEEGLDQAFNALDAQREACEAYVLSQKEEGWKALPARYDDGGFSGGSMERPALKLLLADIEAGKIDTVVVYKIDRFTRSLADFARMVETFDRHQVSFVSVTQSFNTTSSMGRLTLNVLLSFAQFEREVTGERIRDKIAASKARGMWMGGFVPLGYDRAPDQTRTLIINPAEAETVRAIFRRYLELGSVHELQRDLTARDIRTKTTPQRNGTSRGGCAFTRGNLFHLLRNRIYLGEITHHDKIHPGLHPAILERDLFDRAPLQLAAHRCRPTRVKTDHATPNGTITHHALTGRIFDEDGNPMSPTFSYGKQKRLYRYYVSAPLQQGKRTTGTGLAPRRVPAGLIENHLAARLRAILPDDAARSPDILNLITRVELGAGHVKLALHETVPPPVSAPLADGESLRPDPRHPGRVTLVLPFHLSSRKGRTEIRAGQRPAPAPDRILIQALRKARSLVQTDRNGLPLLHASPAGGYDQRLIRLAFLAPDIQRDILVGIQPPGLSLAGLLAHPLPLLWSKQHEHVRKVATAARTF